MDKIKEFQGKYRWLSNFWPCEIIDMEISNFELFSPTLIRRQTYPDRPGVIVYPTTEHAYQAMKLDKHVRLQFIKDRNYCSLSAGEVKKLSRSMNVRSDWDDVKLSVMLKLQRKKFTNDKILQADLLKTVNFPVRFEELTQVELDNPDHFQYIEEGNKWRDRFWGVCDGTGHNHLGKIIMQVRNELIISRTKILFPKTPAWQTWSYE